jgi:hypothetical protein
MEDEAMKAVDFKKMKDTADRVVKLGKRVATSARTLRQRADHAVTAMERVADEIGARGLIDLSDDLRLEARRLRSATSKARALIG